MMGLTAKQLAFLNAHKENPKLCLAQLFYLVKHGSLDGYDAIPMRTLQTYSQSGGQLKNALRKKGYITNTIKKIRTKRPDKALASDIRALATTIDRAKGKVDRQKLLNMVADKINNTIDTTLFKKEDNMNRVEKEAFTDNSLMLCDMIDIGQLQAMKTKEEQIRVLSAMVHYSTSIERNLYGTNETGYTSKSYMRHPQVAFQCIKLICELTGTLQTPATNVNIQVNNILQEIEQKRLKELTEDSSVVDEKVVN